jgi:hypothetical protein
MKKSMLCITLLTLLYSATFSQNIVKDNEGNEYKTIQIGEQLWMQENLKTKHFNNGDEIVTLDDSKAWGRNN